MPLSKIRAGLTTVKKTSNTAYYLVVWVRDGIGKRRGEVKGSVFLYCYPMHSKFCRRPRLRFSPHSQTTSRQM